MSRAERRLGVPPAASDPPLYTRAFWTACIVHVTGGLSLSMWLLLPLFVRHLGASDATIGLLLGVGTAASVAARPGVGVLLDRLGRRAVLLAAGFGNVVSWLPFFWIDRLGPALWGAVVFHTVVWGALFAAYFTYAVDLTPPARRAEGIAVFGVFGMTANGLGPVLGEIVMAAGGHGAFFATAVAFGTVSLALTLLVRPTRPTVAAGPATAPRGAVLALVRQPQIARVLVVSAFLGIGINAAFLFVAPFTRDLGIARAGPFFAAYAGTSILIRLFGRQLLDELGPHRVAIPAFALFAVGLGGLGFLPAPGVLVLCGIACGAGHGSLFPVLNALVVSRAPVRLQGSVVSLHTAALDVGAVVGTPLCGTLAHLAGYRTMFATMAAASVAGLLLMGVDRRRSG